jgi:hypothetical protein
LSIVVSLELGFYVAASISQRERGLTYSVAMQPFSTNMHVLAFGCRLRVIDTLKKIVPIGKREQFVDGAVWTGGEPFLNGI